MLSFPFVLAALALSFAHDTALAARVTIEGRPSPGAAGRLSAKFDRRVVGSGLSDRNDLSYYTNVTIGGVVVEANIDTGSSDLWTDVPIRQSTDTGKPVTINYAIGAVTGTVHTATLQFAGYTVQNQAFLQAKRTTANDKANQHALIGLGPDFGSRNFLALNGSTSDMGDTPLGSIFKQDPSTPNFISFILGRADDNPTKPEARFPGELSIGEVIPGYEAINSQPKMTIPDVQGNKENQHYSALLDSVKVRGASVQLPATTTTSGNNGKLVAVFDSGFSLPQVPKSIVDAMYSSIPGAKYGPVKQLGNQNGWVMDCKHEVTGVSFTFNGLEIPINPLDVTAPIRFLTGNSRDQGCLGLWQEIGGKGSGSLPPGLDVLLGMAFLRNTYMLINVGDFVEGGTNKTADPFIQMLPLTNDTTRVHNEFVNARTNLKNGNVNAAANVSARGSGVLIALLLSMGSALWL